MIRDLFEENVRDVRLAPGAMLLGGFARRFEAPCIAALRRVVEVAPFRHEPRRPLSSDQRRWPYLARCHC